MADDLALGNLPTLGVFVRLPTGQRFSVEERLKTGLFGVHRSRHPRADKHRPSHLSNHLSHHGLNRRPVDCVPHETTPPQM